MAIYKPRRNCFSWPEPPDSGAGYTFEWPSIAGESADERFHRLYEEGWQKAAIFVNTSGKPTHAARQL